MSIMNTIEISKFQIFPKGLKMSVKKILSFLLKSIILISLMQFEFFKISCNNMISSNTDNVPVRKILVLVFPGGKSHNFVMKKLFDYSNKNQNNQKFDFHILVHNWDKEFWDKYPEYKAFGFGNKDSFDGIFNSALDLVRKDPIFGYSKFNKAMIHILNEFMKSGILEDHFRKINFDMVITDIPNFLAKFLRQELRIKLAMYLSPPALPNLFYGMFEINPATLPAIGTPFKDIMNFFERAQNSIFLMGSKIMFKIFMGEQAQTFKNYGYDYSDPDVFLNDAIILIQYPQGFCLSLSKPPNMIFLNFVTPKDSKVLEDEKISAFLDKYNKNIYMSQGTIMKNIDFNSIMSVFENFRNIGFVLSIKKEIADQYSFPKNVLLTYWVNQNDLLGDKRIHAFITHSGINSVLEAIYHIKPVIALGVSLDQVNTAGMIKSRETGIVFTSLSELVPEKLIPAIEEILKPGNIYLENTKKYSKIIKMNSPATKEFLYWLEYGFKLGYDHLLVKAYTHYGYLAINNYDVGIVIIIMLLLLLYLIMKIIKCVFCLNSKIKEKKD